MKRVGITLAAGLLTAVLVSCATGPSQHEQCVTAAEGDRGSLQACEVAQQERERRAEERRQQRREAGRSGGVPRTPSSY